MIHYRDDLRGGTCPDLLVLNIDPALAIRLDDASCRACSSDSFSGQEIQYYQINRHVVVPAR